MSRPLIYDVVVPIESDAAAVLELLLDFERYLPIEPRLASARWLRGPVAPPKAGATAEVTVSVNFSIAYLNSYFGKTRARFTIRKFQEDELIEGIIDSAHVTAFVTIQSVPAISGRDNDVRVRAAVSARRRPVGLVLSTLRTLLVARGNAAIVRAVQRADQGLLSDSALGGH